MTFLNSMRHHFPQLRERNVFNTGEQVEEGGMGVLLRLIDLPSAEGLSADTVTALRKNLLSSSIRIQVPVRILFMSVVFK